MTLPALTIARPEERGAPLDYSAPAPPPGPRQARAHARAREERLRASNALLRAEVAALRREARTMPLDLLRPADLACAWGLPLTTARRLWRARSRR